jgi:predicted N-acetyltransferase YhbS
MTGEIPVIRAGRPDELEALSELAQRSKAFWGYSADFIQACRDELTVREEQLAHTFVMQVERTIAGFYSLSELAPGRAELDFLFVDPWAMRHGYGLALLHPARARAWSLGYAVMVIQGDPHAAAFYQRAGAVRVGERASASIPDAHFRSTSWRVAECQPYLEPTRFENRSAKTTKPWTASTCTSPPTCVSSR